MGKIVLVWASEGLGACPVVAVTYSGFPDIYRGGRVLGFFS
ncbi:MAG: hypothetical protein AAF798_08225 [Bacteroidota bacterium]